MNDWIKAHPDNAARLAEEELILEATELLWKTMNEKNISQSRLAEMMNTSRAFVSQVLSGSRNMTLRTFARLSHVLGVKPTIVDQRTLTETKRVSTITISVSEIVDAPYRLNHKVSWRQRGEATQPIPFKRQISQAKITGTC